MGKTEWIKKNPTTRFKKTRSHNPANTSTNEIGHLHSILHMEFICRLRLREIEQRV